MKIKSYLLSFAKTKGSIAAALAAVLMAANTTVALAQNKATASNGTENTIEGVDKLYGIDPSSAICTTKHTDETDGDKIVCLYNVGAKKFLSVGGMWGTHASLDVTPYPIYMIWNKDSKTYFLESKLKGSKDIPYLGIDNRYGQVFMDTYDGEKSAIRFEKAKDYDSKTNRVYLVKIGNKTTLGYLTAYPNNENKLCDYQASIATETQEYKNQEWKVITKNEYYLLFHTNPAYMKSPVDASFLIACPDFRANDADALKWNITGNNLPTDWKSHVRIGDEKMYKTHDKLSQTGSGSWANYNEDHQRDYGQYFYCYTKGLRGFTFFQDVKVHKAGWYLLRCNGFSTSNSSENIKQNGKPLANLFITELGADNKPNDNKYSTATLNGISQADAYQLAKTHNGKPYDGAGIGKAFFEGKYENQVQICLDKAPNGYEISNNNPVTLRIGFYVDPTDKSEVDANELTAVDNFKLDYAGPRRNPELILDEESTNLRYLTEATDEYKNSVLHLNRKLNDNMWNSLILPVDLTWGQMKRTFGDAVKVAKLEALTENSVQFVTVEPDSDEDVMVTAFEPYIVYPPYTQVKSAPYTVEHFYTSVGEDNSEWLGTDYQPSKDENNRLTKTLKADHYDITMVTLNRDTLNKYLNTTNWESITKFKTIDGNYGKMVCIGTMAKTYDNGKILSDRDNLNGDYFMYKGKLIQVPSGKKDNGEPYSYGLKAFRCWFELTDKTTGKPSQVSLLIDGVEDSTTGIDDIHGNTDCTSYKRGIDGVFNMNGQMVRRSCSLEELPKGMYVVNGKKIIIR